MVLADAVKKIDWRALNAKFAVIAPDEVVRDVLDRVAALLGIFE